MSEMKPSETKPRKMVKRSLAIGLGTICIVLVVVGVVGAFAYIMPMINDKDNKISSLNAQVSQLNSKITNLQNQVASLNSTVDTLKIGFRLVDPSYQEMLTFIADESASGKPASEKSVFNSTSVFVNDAFSEGYKCGTVLIDLPAGTYCVACFNTTDRGLFFVDAGLVRVVKLVIGQKYYLTNQLATPSYDDTVLDYTIIW